MASEIPSPAAVGLAGVGSAGVSGTTNSGDSDFSKAMTDATGFAGRGAFARAFAGAGAGFGFGCAFGADGSLSAGTLRFMTVRPGFAGVGAGGADEVTTGFAGADRSANAAGDGRSSGVTEGAMLATGGGRSTTRRSGTATRRSSQGKAKPGSPN